MDLITILKMSNSQFLRWRHDNGGDHVVIEKQELEEIVRQAYFIGVTDVERNHPSVKPEFRENRLKAVHRSIDAQRSNQDLKPFDYKKWLSK